MNDTGFGASHAAAPPPGASKLPAGKIVMLLLTLLLFGFFARWCQQNINFSDLAHHFARIPLWAIAGSIAINICALLLYGERMAMLLNGRFWPSFCVINVGYALNNVMPFRLGDAAKVYIARSLYNISVPKLVTSTLVEKLIDLFKLALLAMIVVVFAADRLLHREELALPLIIVMGGVGAIFAFRIAIRQIDRWLPGDSALKRTILEFHEASTGYPMGRILLMTVAIWSANVALVFFTFNTYIPGLHFGILDAVALLIIVSLAIAVPSAPAGIGVFEAGVLIYLTRFFGVSNEAALAAAVVFHLAISIPQLLFVGILLLRNSLTLRGLRNG
jgi:uncharacterized protein (TIRG00374 family)